LSYIRVAPVFDVLPGSRGRGPWCHRHHPTHDSGGTPSVL
jgi:hypothetical protein